MAEYCDDVQAQSAPNLGIPSSSRIVKVSVIDSTSRLAGIKAETLTTPRIGSFTVLEPAIPSYSFLVENEAQNQAILYDLGVGKNWVKQYPPDIVKMINEANGWTVTIEKDVIDILRDHDYDPVSINAIVWSHHHFDHLGDPTAYPRSTDLVVGPGFRDAFVPGYPTNPKARVSESAWEGRSLREVDFANGGNSLKIGGYSALDYFGDGSFYLLDSPGHAIGHMCGLARTTANPPTFLFMGGDAAHHGSEFRPTKYLPLPKEITPHPLRELATEMPATCPGEFFQRLHPTGSSMEPFTEPPGGYDLEECKQSIRKMEAFDAHENIFSVIAHDQTLLDVMEYFPRPANEWKAKGWKRKGLWKFLGDFIGEEESRQLQMQR